MRLACAVLLLVVGSGCKSQKLVAVETEVAAAKARLATLDKKRRELLDETKKVDVSRKTYAQQADEAEVAKQRLVAAGLVLHGDPVPDSVLLEDALRSKSPELGKLAASIVQRQLPCVDEKDEPENDDEGPEDGSGDCSPPALPDECEGVPETVMQSFTWSCEIVKRKATRPVALCTSDVNGSTSTWPLSAPSQRLDAQAVRMAFEHQGRLVVADWPRPSTDLYRPRNDDELAQCQSQNDDAQCIRTCDERYGRLDEVCGRYGDDGDYGDGEEDDGENPEVAAARRASQEADAEAARAREELEYQQCLAACEPAEEEYEPEVPFTAELSLRKDGYPGVFIFDVSYTDPEPDAGAWPAEVLVLGFGESLLAVEDPAPETDTVDALTELLLVDEVKTFESPMGLVLYGVDSKNRPAGALVSRDGTMPPSMLTREKACELTPQSDKAFAKACAALPPQKATGVDASVDAGVDAGVGDAGVDAGVDGGAP